MRSSLQEFDGMEDVAAQLLSRPLPEVVSRVEGILYTLADAAVSTDASVADTTQKQGRDWLSGLTDGLESILKVLKDGLQAVHVPYAYGFAIILLTILVKAVTFPLTKKQVESTLAMQNLSPKIKAIQQRYAGDQERIQLETARLYKQAGVNPLAGCLPTLATIPVWIGLYRALSNVANEGLLTEGFFWIPSLAGPTTLGARQSGSGVSWLLPFIDGHPPLGWGDTIAYLILPALLIVSQYVSMQMVQTPQSNDPSQKNTQVILKFLPLMIGYFALSVPSGLSLYWLTNNILSTGQQLWLRKLGGAKPPVSKDERDIINPGQAIRPISSPVIESKGERRGERFRQLKMEEALRKAEQAKAAKHAAEMAAKASAMSASDTDGSSHDVTNDEPIDLSSAKDALEEIYSGNGAAGPDSSASEKNKHSKRRHEA